MAGLVWKKGKWSGRQRTWIASLSVPEDKITDISVYVMSRIHRINSDRYQRVPPGRLMLTSSSGYRNREGTGFTLIVELTERAFGQAIRARGLSIPTRKVYRGESFCELGQVLAQASI